MLRYSKLRKLGVPDLLFVSFNRFTTPTFMECVNNKVLGAYVFFFLSAYITRNLNLFQCVPDR